MVLPREHRALSRLRRNLHETWIQERSANGFYGAHFLSDTVPRLPARGWHFLREGRSLKAMFRMAAKGSQMDSNIRRSAYEHSRDPAIPLAQLSEAQRERLNPADQNRGLLSAEDSILRRFDAEGKPISEADLKSQDMLLVLQKHGFSGDALIQRDEAMRLRKIFNYRANIIAEAGKISNAMVRHGRTPQLVEAEAKLRENMGVLQKEMHNLGPMIAKLEGEYNARWEYYKSAADRETLLSNMGNLPKGTGISEAKHGNT